MSVTITLLPSFALIAHDNIIASNDTVGELASSFSWTHVGAFHQHIHMLLLSHLDFRNMRYLSAFFDLYVTCLLCSQA